MNHQAIYELNQKDSCISIQESVERLNLLADFIQTNALKINDVDAASAHKHCNEKRFGVVEYSIIGMAAQDPAFNAKGLWLTEKTGEDYSDFVDFPYPHFKSYQRVTYHPTAKTKEEAMVNHDRYLDLYAFFGLHPTVYAFLMNKKHYQYSFMVFEASIIFWLTALQIPKSVWSTLDFSTKTAYGRLRSQDMVIRIRAFADVLAQSPLSCSYDATYELFGQSHSDLERAFNKERKVVTRFFSKKLFSNFWNSFKKTA